MPKPFCHRLIVALLLACVSLPGAALMAGAPPDSPEARVDANTADSPWTGVVAIRVGDGIFTGVAVSPHHILTAAHVTGGASGPEAMSVMINAGGDQPVRRAVTRIDVFPGYAFPYDDLALLTLETALPEGVASYPINDTPVQPGQTVLTLVGYGASGPGNSGVTVGQNSSVKRVGENMLDMLSPRLDASGRSSSFFLYDFDGPEGNGPLGGPSLGNARESAVAIGDSGSPAFTTVNGYRTVTGINTVAHPLNSGRPANYTFGQGGAGILLSDARFIKWLLEKSNQEVRPVSTLSPLSLLNMRWPLVAGGVVASSLVGSWWWWRRRQA